MRLFFWKQRVTEGFAKDGPKNQRRVLFEPGGSDFLFCRLTMQVVLRPLEPGCGRFFLREQKGERRRFLVSAYKTESSKNVVRKFDLDHFFRSES